MYAFSKEKKIETGNQFITQTWNFNYIQKLKANNEVIYVPYENINESMWCVEIVIVLNIAVYTFI